MYKRQAEEIDKKVNRSFIDGTQKVWYSEHDTEIQGQLTDEEHQLILILMNRENAGKHVKGILKEIRKEKPIHYIDFTFSKYDANRNEVIYKGVL